MNAKHKKLSIGVIFGGKSAEHEVSLQSAKNVIEAIDKDKYEVVLIGIDKKGRWYLNEDSKFLLHTNSPRLIKLDKTNKEVALVRTKQETGQLVNVSDHRPSRRITKHIDVIFPVLHGPFGEDGAIQGLLKLANIPFVGAGVLGSAIGMDKDVMKRLFKNADIPIPKFLIFNRISRDKINFKKVIDYLGRPFFVKPANLGSSVGINKVGNEKQFKNAIKEAFEYDNKILIEEYIKGRELECSVLGNNNPIASVPGEIIPHGEFYSYKAKYIDESGAILKIPAKLPAEVIKKVKHLAIKAFKTLCCQGMARVDFFLRNNNEVVVNEINTIPGFTKISMYPKLWEASGISYTELIDRLIQLALERFEQEKKLKTSL